MSQYIWFYKYIVLKTRWFIWFLHIYVCAYWIPVIYQVFSEKINTLADIEYWETNRIPYFIKRSRLHFKLNIITLVKQFINCVSRQLTLGYDATVYYVLIAGQRHRGHFKCISLYNRIKKLKQVMCTQMSVCSHGSNSYFWSNAVAYTGRHIWTSQVELI